jgi:predicted CoA-binding protein
MTQDSCSVDNRPGSMKQAHPPTTDEIRSVLRSTKTIAVIGLSDDPAKPAHGVASYLKQAGYRIIGVHPKAQTALGETAYSSLAAIPDPVDMVYMFRGADAAPTVVDETLSKGAKTLWMPEGVVNDDAATKGRAAGLTVIMDRCALKEHKAQN